MTMLQLVLFLTLFIRSDAILRVASSSSSSGPKKKKGSLNNVAVAEGKSGGLRWDNLSVQLPKRGKLLGFLKKNKEKEGRYLLHENSGFVGNGQVCAIIG